MLPVRQHLPTDHLADVRQVLAEKLQAAGLAARLRTGEKIAITAGSRGYGGEADVVQGVAEFVRRSGGEPVIIPAMGSHGGATAEGQKKILEALGISDSRMNAPVLATMETVCLGESRSKAKAHLDKIASECACIIVVGRVKTHPENTEGIASGLLKMTTVGLGKQRGAQEAHNHGLWASIRAVPEITFATGKILCGVAVVENAFRQPLAVEVVPGTYEAFREADQRLLLLSKQHFARVPFAALDVLIVDQMGKNIAGTGMDLNVIGPWRIKGGERNPDYQRIVVLSLTPQSNGNALGVGLADFTTSRLEKAFDRHPTYINLLTATEPGTRNTAEACLPAVLPSDRAAIEAALYSGLAPNPKVCRIKNTADLGEFWVSESLLDEVRAASSLEILGAPQEFSFDSSGNLV